MSDMERFSDKIRERIRLNQQELSQRQVQMNEQMTQMLEQQEGFNRKGRNIVTKVIYPRLQKLSAHFDNAKLLELDPDHDLHALCEFSHTSRYPAKVMLDIALLPAKDFSNVAVHYGLSIFPSLLEYPRAEEKEFSVDAEDAIAAWIEEKLLGFLEIYLQLKTHPLYQKDNLVTDPVCKMTFPVDEAASRIELNGRTFYFCSEVCRDNFSKSRNT